MLHSSPAIAMSGIKLNSSTTPKFQIYNSQLISLAKNLNHSLVLEFLNALYKCIYTQTEKLAKSVESQTERIL